MSPVAIMADGTRVATSDDAIALATWRGLHNSSDTEPLVPLAQVGNATSARVAWYWISTGFLPDTPDTVARALREASGGEATWSPDYVSAAAHIGTVLQNTEQRNEAYMLAQATAEEENQRAVAALVSAEPYNAEFAKTMPAVSVSIDPIIAIARATSGDALRSAATVDATAPAKKNNRMVILAVVVVALLILFH